VQSSIAKAETAAFSATEKIIAEKSVKTTRQHADMQRR